MAALPVSEMEASGQSEGGDHTRRTRVHILAVPLASCVSVGKIIDLSEPRSPPVQGGNGNAQRKGWIGGADGTQLVCGKRCHS